jgi:hypothetical protein
MKTGTGQNVTPGSGDNASFFADFAAGLEDLSTEEVDEVVNENEEQDEGQNAEEGDESFETEAEADASTGDSSSGEEGSEEESGSEEDGSESGEEDYDEESSYEEGDSEEGEVETIGDYESIMGGLVESGTLEFDPEKEYSSGAKGIEELVEDTVNRRLTEAVEKSKKEDHRDVNALRDYLSENPGATVEDFVTDQEDVDYATVDESNPQYQIYLIEDFLTIQGYDRDEINDTLKEYRSAGSLSRHAKNAKNQMIKHQQSAMRAKSEARKAAQLREQEEANIRRNEFEQKILKTKSVGGIDLSIEERQKLADYILKPVAEGKTQLMMDEDADSNAALLYAYIKQRNLDLTKLERKAETKATLKFKKNMNKHTDRLAKGGNRRSSGVRDAAPGDLSGLDSWKMK